MQAVCLAAKLMVCLHILIFCDDSAIWALPEMKPTSACTSALLMRRGKPVHYSLTHTTDTAVTVQHAEA